MIVYSVATLILIILSFISGLKLSDHYHKVSDAEKKYALEKQYLRLKAGMDADDIMQPYVAPPDKRNFTVPSEFINRLQTTGNASMRITKNNIG